MVFKMNWGTRFKMIEAKNLQLPYNLPVAYSLHFLTPKHITTITKNSPPPLIISSPQKTTPNQPNHPGQPTGQDALRALRHYADTSRTRRAVLQLLAQELAPDETKELRDIPMFFFRRRKTQGGGALGGWMIHNYRGGCIIMYVYGNGICFFPFNGYR